MIASAQTRRRSRFIFFGFISQHDPVEGLQPGYFSPSIGNMQGALANADGAIMMMTAMAAII